MVCCSTLYADAAGGSYSWNGFYMGVNTGGVANDSRYTLSPSGNFLVPPFVQDNGLRTDSSDLDDPAFTIGGQVGYNYQIHRVVIGLETDFNYTTVDENETVDRALVAPLSGRLIHNVKQDIDFLGTVRARVGFAPTDRLLLYGTGGFAYGHIKSSSDILFTLGGDNYPGSKSTMQPGWTVGAGAEYALTDHLTMKLEYLYVDLGKLSYDDISQFPGYTYSTDIKTRVHIPRLGLNFKF
jgi:outer membrane immunogenic protein